MGSLSAVFGVPRDGVVRSCMLLGRALLIHRLLRRFPRPQRSSGRITGNPSLGRKMASAATTARAISATTSYRHAIILPMLNANDWPETLDALAAAPGNHTLLFENDAVRVLDTLVRPGQVVPLHGHQWPSANYLLSSPLHDR